MNAHAMHTYIVVSFWLGVVGGALRLSMLLFANYPRKSTTGYESDVFVLVYSLMFTFWAFCLL